MNHKIRVLFLDIDNTLLDFDAGAAWGMEQCFRKAGLEYRSEMFSVFTEENNKIWQRIERRELTMDDLFHVRWQAILAHLGLEADGVEMEKEFRRLLHLTAIPVEGAEENYPKSPARPGRCGGRRVNTRRPCARPSRFCRWNPPDAGGQL